MATLEIPDDKSPKRGQNCFAKNAARHTLRVIYGEADLSVGCGFLFSVLVLIPCDYLVRLFGAEVVVQLPGTQKTPTLVPVGEKPSSRLALSV